MRRPKNYYSTSDETKEVLSGHETSVAKSYGCTPAYIFNIKNGDEPDPYPPFREWAQRCATGGADLQAYILDMQKIDHHAKYGTLGTDDLCAYCFEQIKSYADRIKSLAEIVSDGKADEREAEQILKFCATAETEINNLREMALSVKSGYARTREIYRRGERHFKAA